MYRKDSKGFRVSYEQPSWVDEYYQEKKEWRQSQREQFYASGARPWAHPSSGPNFAYDRPNPTEVPAAAMSQIPLDPRTTALIDTQVLDHENRRTLTLGTSQSSIATAN